MLKMYVGSSNLHRRTPKTRHLKNSGAVWLS